MYHLRYFEQVNNNYQNCNPNHLSPHSRFSCRQFKLRSNSVPAHSASRKTLEGGIWHRAPVLWKQILGHKGWLHGEFQPGQIFQRLGWKTNSITWEISARTETECEGENRCFLYLFLYTRVPLMRLCIFSPCWNFLSITWGISARSTGLKIASREAQTGLKFQPGSPDWNFLHVIANSVLQGFYRKPGMNFQPGWPKVHPGLKIPM